MERSSERSSGFASYPSLRDRVVIITGGATGIGEAMVEAFAAQHARVAFLDILAQAGEALCNRLAGPGRHRPRFYRCDLTSIPELQRAFASIVDECGPVDVLVNNAANDVRHSMQDITSDNWDGLIAVNLKHQFFASQAVIPSMRAARRGSIINMSSISWMIPSLQVPVYVTSKAGIVGLTRTMAHELGPDNIRVNCVLPGAILTERQRRLWLTDAYQAEILGRQALKRLLMPDEVARLVLFLAADDSSAITNQSYVVDGGWV